MDLDDRHSPGGETALAIMDSDIAMHIHEDLLDADTFHEKRIGPFEDHIRSSLLKRDVLGNDGATLELPNFYWQPHKKVKLQLQEHAEGCSEESRNELEGERETWNLQCVKEDGSLVSSGPCSAYEWNCFTTMPRETQNFNEILQFQKASLIQATWKGFRARQSLHQVLFSIHLIQSFFRTQLNRRKAERIADSISLIQTSFDVFLSHRRWIRSLDAVCSIQSSFRIFMCRKQLISCHRLMEEVDLSESDQENSDSSNPLKEGESSIQKAFKRLQNIESKALHSDADENCIKGIDESCDTLSISRTIRWRSSLELPSTKILSPCTTRLPSKSILKNRKKPFARRNPFNFRFARLQNFNFRGGAQRVRR